RQRAKLLSTTVPPDSVLLAFTFVWIRLVALAGSLRAAFATPTLPTVEACPNAYELSHGLSLAAFGARASCLSRMRSALESRTPQVLGVAGCWQKLLKRPRRLTGSAESGTRGWLQP